MKKLLALALVVMVAGSALAQDLNGMGIFFDNAVFDETTNTVATAGAPLDMYVVLIASEFETIGGYECGIEFSDPTVFALGATGPNGWTNFGSGALDHLVGFMAPVQTTVDGAAVLATINILYGGSDVVDITMMDASIPSFPGFPAIANGANPEELRACLLTTGVAPPGVVANLNGEGITAMESHTLTEVKALFD